MSNKQNKLIKELISKLEKDGVEVSKYTQELDNINKNLKDKKYGLVWEQHTEPLVEELKNKVVELQEVKERRIFKGEEYTNNFLIEGDNLESLNALLKSGLEGKVNVIYIDPPYNTGNKDFVYNDSYVDKENSFRHSKWLSFMEKRLKLARDLMTEDGVIFISIDDNEQANLKLMCDSVFGENNFITNFVWEKNQSPSNLSNNVRSSTEYVLAYSKNIVKTELVSEYKIKNDDSSMYNKTNSEKVLVFPKESVDISIPDGKYLPQRFDTTELISEVEVVEGKLQGDLKVRSRFIWLQDTLDSRLGEGYRILIKGKKFVPRSIKVGRKTKVRPKTLLKGSEVGTTLNSNRELINLFGESPFNYTKPLGLIKELVKYHMNKNATVLDFFAGSGTTGQAVLELNKEDGGNRNFILCSNNENNICKDVTYQRLSKVINGYTTPKGEEVEGINANLTYLKTNLIDKEEDYIMYDSTHLEYIVNLLKLKYGITDELELNNSGYIENVIIKLPSETQDIYIYLNDYIDEEDFNKVELDKEKESLIYVDESLVNDKNLLLKGFKNVNSVNKYFK